MKVKIKVSEIQGAIKQCANAIDPKDMIRSNIMIEAEEGAVRIKATNGQYSLERTIYCDVQEEGIATVDGKMAYGVIAKASGECTIIADLENMIIKTNGRTKLPNLHRDIPLIETATGSQTVFSAIEFKKAIQTIDYAIGEDQSRLILTGAHIVSDGNVTTITALDGFRLAQTQISCEGDRLDVVIPSKILAAVCDAIVDGNLCLSTNGNHVSFSGDGFLVNSLALSGTYIDTTRIIPTEFKTNALVKTSDIKDCANTATLASGTSNLVKIELSKDKLTVKSNSDEADFQAEIEAMYDGDDVIIGFNLKYLIQMLSHIETEQCEFRLNSPIAPAVIVPHADNVNELHLILPVRLSRE